MRKFLAIENTELDYEKLPKTRGFRELAVVSNGERLSSPNLGNGEC